MPGPNIVLWNKAENRLEGVPASDVDAAIASGRYQQHQASVTTEVHGVPLTRNVTGPGGAAAIGPDERVMDVEAARAGAEASRDRRAEGLSSPWYTFAEAAADTATLGLVHERGEEADIRRSSDSKAAFLGGAVGMFAPGPGFVANAGRRAGEAAALKLLGSVKGVAGRALGEAASGAAVMGAVALGQQASDAAITDHKFSAEAVASHVGLGALLGGAFGAAGGLLERLPAGSRAKATAQGGLIDPKSPESAAARSAVDDAFGALDDAVLDYARRAGAVRVLSREHPEFVPAGLPDRVDAAIRNAEATGRRLREFDVDAVLHGTDMRLRDRFQAALDRHQRAVLDVEASFEATAAERAARKYHEPGKMVVEKGRAPFDPEAAGFRSGEARSMEEIAEAQGAGADMHAVVLDSLMTPERRAMYERTYGRAWEDLPPETPVGRNASTGEENLGGRITPTSEAGTNAARPGRRVDATGDSLFTSKMPEGAPFAGMDGVQALDRALAFKGGVTRGAVVGPERLAAAVEARGNQMVRGRASRRGFEDLDASLASSADRAAGMRRLEMGVKGDNLMVTGRATPRMERPGAGPSSFAGTEADLANLADVAFLRGNAMVRGRAEAPAPAGTAAMDAVAAPDPAMPVPRAPETLYPDIARPVPLKGPSGEASRALVEDLWRVRSLEPPRANPVDRAAAKMTSLTDSIREASGGKLDSAAAVDLFKAEGRAAPGNSLGAQIDQIIAARRIARAAADESRGTATPLREAGRERVLAWLGKRVASNTVKRAVGGAIGWSAGGPLGGLLGAAFANKVFGVTGRVASASGTLATAVESAASKALRATGKGTVAGLAQVKATYGGEHEPDVLKRAETVKQLARNPGAVRELVAKSLGDSALLHPQQTAALGDLTHRQIVNLSLRAPLVVWDALGRPRAVEEREARRFEEYERATFDLPGLLRQYAAGRLTDVGAAALSEQFPEVRSRLVAGALADQEALRRLPGDRLAAVERALGVPLTAAADPSFVARQQINYGPPPGPTTGGGPTAPAPTPSSGGPSAPGN